MHSELEEIQDYKKSSNDTNHDGEPQIEKNLKSVSFLEPISVTARDLNNMELDTQNQSQINHATNGVKHRGELLDSEVAQEIRYLDEVLEANCCDPGSEMPSNGSCPSTLTTICVDGNGPSVHVTEESSLVTHEVIIEGKRENIYCDGSLNSTKPNGHSGRSPEKGTTIKKEACFELRAFHEEKKPAKLFDPPSEKEIRVKKIRPSEEIAELEKERLELIKDQAVKKNPGIAAKWWNPPQEKTLEEELEPEQLESLKKYEERKQRRSDFNRPLQTSSKQTVSFVQPELESKEDIVVKGINFSAARQQFVQMEHNKIEQPTKRSVAPQIYSAKPFSRSSDTDRSNNSIIINPGRITMEDGGEIHHVKAEPVFLSSEASSTQLKNIHDPKVKNDDFTCARAVMTILKDEESDLQQCQLSMNSSYHHEEIDSGLDDLSLRSQDTTVLESLSNDLSMDNISDSGASNEATSAFLENSLGDYSFPSTPVATTPINGRLEDRSKSPGDRSCSDHSDSMTEYELEYHAGILVQNAIQQAIAHQTNQWEPLQAMQQSSPISEKDLKITEPSAGNEEKLADVPSVEEPSTVEVKTTSSPQITVRVPTIQATSNLPVNTGGGVPSPSSSSPKEKTEFSYFSKYSEAAELRSTASVSRAQDAEITSGPFKLRSHKQRTLSMIEEEIRAAQQREEELRKQRQVLSTRSCINPVHKQKTNSLPAKLVLTGKTAPGKIEKLRSATPVSPASSEGALPSPLSDLGSDDSGGGRPKNYMQTLMEDFETHKVRRREKAEDSSVLEATRVTRRKSNMALRWEAGIYANQDEAEEEEEEE